jgi:hypothetical protein
MYKQTELQLYLLRFSNNNTPIFTDVELLTCAIFSELVGCKNKKHGYLYISNHYSDWFPYLPSYEVYSRKLTKFKDALAYIFWLLTKNHNISKHSVAMIDTAPITVCQKQHSTKSKTAQPVASKGYCPAKKEYYIGVKLQIVAQKRTNALPFPIDYHIESAATHDLEICKQTLPLLQLEQFDLYGDKAYIDQSFQNDLFENNYIHLKTPIKKFKGQPPLTLFQKAANTIHASVRQPVETLFGWINDKTNIQNASKVRSIDGLFYHVNVKMVAALLVLIMNLN